MERRWGTCAIGARLSNGSKTETKITIQLSIPMGLGVLASDGSHVSHSALPFPHFIHLPRSNQRMEIVLKSLARPQSLLDLDDVLAQDSPWETLRALLSAIRDITIATYFEAKHQQELVGSLQALQIQESLFRPALRKFKLDWVPTSKEEDIIQAAHLGFYLENNIQGAFYKYGGLHAIVGLVLVFRDTESILRQWSAIEAQSVQQWLVYNVSQLVKRQENNWISKFLPRSMRSPLEIRFFR